MPNSNTPSIDSYRWGDIFGLLSLDLLHPFAAEMGLQLPEGTEFMIGLRRSIEEVETVTDPSFAPAVFQWLTLEYGSVFVDHLLRWGESVFRYGIDDDGGAFWWRQIVFAGNRGDIDMPEFISLVHNSLTQNPGRDIGERVPTTAWDKHLYRREEYDELTMETVQSTIYHYSFVNAWHEALQTVSKEVDWDEIYRWGIRTAEHIRGFARPEPPKVWELPLPWR